MSGIVGVLMLGVVAVIVYQIVRAGSQGPTAISNVGKAVGGFYSTLMK